jgi:hypothetical protein
MRLSKAAVTIGYPRDAGRRRACDALASDDVVGHLSCSSLSLYVYWLTENEGGDQAVPPSSVAASPSDASYFTSTVTRIHGWIQH